jgi:alkylation response protein AidB-like acyl-CoA dehydrogenase
LPATGALVLDLGLSGEQEQLQESVRALLEKESGPELVREVEPLGFSTQLWDHVVQLGIPEMAVPEDLGGGGAGLLDVALVAELGGAFLAPVPLAESVVANRLLARLGTAEAGRALATAIENGRISTLALSEPVDGTASWVPAGAVAHQVIARHGDQVLLATGPAPGAAIPNLGSLPLAHRSLADAEVIAEGPAAVAAVARAQDEWRVLLAAWLEGAGRRALEIAVEYTTARQAFGQFIASYQSVAHRMADALTALDGARWLHRKAAWAVDEDGGRRHELALMAVSFGAESAEQAATDALHFHGGYGFMLEYDIQLYLRRIKAYALLNGDPARELGLLADELWGAPGAGGA